MCHPFRAARAAARASAVLPFVAATVLAFSPLRSADACDICAIYTATELQESRTGLRVGVAQQLSSFATLQYEGDEVPNPNGERLTSAITQLVAGYQVRPRLGVQATLPWIYRDFRRSREGEIQRGNEVGIGDLSLLASYTAFSRTNENSVLRLTLLGGVKFPTGSTDRLREEGDVALDPNDVRDRLNDSMGYRRHAPISRPQAHLGPGETDFSGIHGHDLALGTGSFDPVFGLQGLWTWKRAVLTGSFQYVLRTEGDYDYEYADEITSAVNPGIFVLLDHRHSLVLQMATTIESKGKDSVGGETLDDTALTAVYLGPGLHFTRGSALSFDFAADLPVLLDNSSLQIVPDFRLRAGFVWRF